LGAAVVAAAAAAAETDVPTIGRCSLNSNFAGEHVAGVELAPAAGDELPLRFSWTLQYDVPGGAQQSFQVDILPPTSSSSSLATQQPVWSSGSVTSGDPFLAVPVSAVSGVLQPGSVYSWRVAATLSPGAATTAFCSGSFETAPAATVFPGPARWIGGGGLLRAALDIGPNVSAVTSARAYVSGLGSFYLFVNGARDPVGDNVMDPTQTVYSLRAVYQTFDIAPLLRAGSNDVAVLLGNYKLGYNNIWCDMIKAGGPNGCRAAIAAVVVTLADGSTRRLDTSNASVWTAEPGPVVWDHFFHGETFDASGWGDWGRANSGSGSGSGNSSSVSSDTSASNTTSVTTGTGAVAAAAATVTTATTAAQQKASASFMSPPASFPDGMGVPDGAGGYVAFGQLSPAHAPPLRVRKTVSAVQVSTVRVFDVGEDVLVFDFGENAAGMSKLSLPAGHNIPAGTQLRVEHGEVVGGPLQDAGGSLCSVCPSCEPCTSNTCLVRGDGAPCDHYCDNPAIHGKIDDHALRTEPCFPHQTYGNGQFAGDRYVGDFNNANMTNVYVVQGNNVQGEEYRPFFAGGGFRYAQLSGLPSSHNLTPAQVLALVAQVQINSRIEDASSLQLPAVRSTGDGSVPDVFNTIHSMTRATQLSNLWTIPTDCPQRERRGWFVCEWVGCWVRGPGASSAVLGRLRRCGGRAGVRGPRLRCYRRWSVDRPSSSSPSP
jgi:hypothetical protein